MDKILSLTSGTSTLNLMVASTDDGGIFVTKHDLSRLAGMVFNGSMTLHKIDGMPGDCTTVVLRTKLANGPALLTFVTAHPTGSVKIGKDELTKVIKHFTSLNGYNLRMGLLDMPRLAA